MSVRKLPAAAIAMAITLLFTQSALAHVGDHATGGFASGFTHPLFGWDHVVAMIAVGLWAGVLGRPAIWVLPIVFPLLMVAGAALGLMGVPLPAVETGIASSALILGLLIVFMAKPPLWVAGILVGAFAIFHGHAHGTELPDAASPYSYAIGFVLATLLLHGIGIGVGSLNRLPVGETLIRISGGVISAIGAAFLFGIA